MLSDRLIACGCSRDLVFIKDFKIFKTIKRAHTGWINGILLVPNCTNKIITGGGKIVKLWDLERFKCVEKFGKHKSPISCMNSFKEDPGDFQFMTGSDFPETTIRIFSYKKLCELRIINVGSAVRKIESFMNGKRILCMMGTLSNMSASIINLKSGLNKNQSRLNTSRSFVDINVLSQRKFVLTESSGFMKVFSIKDTRIPTMSMKFDSILGGKCEHLGKGKFLSFNVYLGKISFLQPITGLEIGTSPFPQSFQMGYDDMILLKYIPEERCVITSTKDCIVRVWKLNNIENKVSLNCMVSEKCESFVNSVAIIPKNDRIFALPRISFIYNSYLQDDEGNEETEGEKEEEKEETTKKILRFNDHIVFPKYLLYDTQETLDNENSSKISEVFFKEEEEEYEDDDSSQLLFTKVMFGYEPETITMENVMKFITVFHHLQKT